MFSNFLGDAVDNLVKQVEQLQREQQVPGAEKEDKPVAIPPILPCLMQKGLGDFMDKALGEIIVDNGARIHEMVDVILDANARASGKGPKASSGAAAMAPAYTKRDPKVRPTAEEMKKTSYTPRDPNRTRSFIEPMSKRLDSGATVGAMFKEAALECKTEVAKIIKECEARGKKFFDETFYFNDRNNLYPEGSPPDCTVSQPHYTQRLGEMYPKAQFFSDGVNCEDIVQGGVGDCYFIGAVSSLAASAQEYEEVKAIDRLFPLYSEKWGVYGCMFFKCGGWEWVIVDDTIAVVKERSGQSYPLFASSSSFEAAELWPMILEKAYAKMHFNWDIIDGGWAREALVDLTGGLQDTIDLATTHKGMSWAQFQDLAQNPYTVLGCCVGAHVQASGGAAGGCGEEGAIHGLFHGHQYSVVQAVESNGTPFVRVRNPWGNDAEWTGRFGDNSDEWLRNEVHKRNLKFEGPRADGAFWMLWEDFKQIMTTIDVVRFFQDDWCSLTMFGQAEALLTESNAYILQIADNKTSVVVSLGQEDPKMKGQQQKAKSHKNQYDPYRVMKLSISQLREMPTSLDHMKTAIYQKVDSKQVRQRSVDFSLDLEPGIYSIVPYVASPQDTGIYLRVFGPPDADFAIWRFSDGERRRQAVGNCPMLTERPSGTTASATKAHHVHVDAVPSSPSRVSEVESLKAQLAQLQRQLAEKDRTIAELENHVSRQEVRKATRPVERHVAPEPVAPQAKLGLENEKWGAALQQVFGEVSKGQSSVDERTALNALRLVVTLGGGLDEVFKAVVATKPQKVHGRLDFNEFYNCATATIDGWEPLQK